MHRKLLFICMLFTVSIIGCQKSGSTLDHPTPPLHSLNIEGELQLRGEVSWVDSTDELKTEIWLVNTSSDTTTVETGACAFNVMAYTISEEDRELVWYNKMPENYVCPDVLYTYRIPPNDTIELESQIYISGNNWKWRVPHGEWKFVLEAGTEDGQSITADANTLVVQ
jgi:hypothetical protein